MRIGLIAPPWIPVPPPAYGGTESVIDRLAASLGQTDAISAIGRSANGACRASGVELSSTASSRRVR
jgi:hypothetical protein